MSDMSELKKEDPRIFGDRFQPLEAVVQQFSAKVPPGITREHLLNPEYWSHVAGAMQPYAEITVRAEDGTFLAKLLVIDCGRGWAKTRVLHWFDLTAKDASAGAASAYSIEWKGGTRKHVILRNSDQAVIHEGEQRKAGAEAWLQNFLTSGAAVAPELIANTPG
jgi:hypothetical protein